MDRTKAEAGAPQDETAEAFRLAMRRTGATVCAVTTTMADGSFRGATVNTMTSVSLRPPSLLVSLDSTARIHAAVLSRRRFAVSVFAPEHQEIAAAFANPLRHAERFKVGTWRVVDELPVLDDAVASFICRIGTTLPFATHTLVVGLVDRIELGARREPLLYQDRHYGRFEGP